MPKGKTIETETYSGCCLNLKIAFFSLDKPNFLYITLACELRDICVFELQVQVGNNDVATVNKTFILNKERIFIKKKVSSGTLSDHYFEGCH